MMDKELSNEIEFYGDSAEYEFYLVDRGNTWRSFCVYYSDKRKTIEFHEHYYPKEYGNSDASFPNRPLRFDACSSKELDEIAAAFCYFINNIKGVLRHKKKDNEG